MTTANPALQCPVWRKRSAGSSRWNSPLQDRSARRADPRTRPRPEGSERPKRRDVDRRGRPALERHAVQQGNADESLVLADPRVVVHPPLLLDDECEPRAGGHHDRSLVESARHRADRRAVHRHPGLVAHLVEGEETRTVVRLAGRPRSARARSGARAPRRSAASCAPRHRMLLPSRRPRRRVRRRTPARDRRPAAPRRARPHSGRSRRGTRSTSRSGCRLRRAGRRSRTT